MTNLADLLPAGGGQNNTDFVADGNITAGVPVVLTAAGKAAAITGSGGSVGTSAVFESATSAHMSATYDSTNNKIVICYRDDGNSYYGTAVVATVSGDSISFGTPAVFSSSSTQRIAPVFDTYRNRVVIIYKNDGDGSKPYGISGAVSGTSISFATAALIAGISCDSVSACFDSVNNQTIFSYARSASDGQTGAATVDAAGAIGYGSTITFVSGGAPSYTQTVFDPDTSKAVVFFTDSADSYKGKARVITNSSGTISFGTVATMDSSAFFLNTGADYDTSANKMVIAFADQNTSNYGFALVGTVSGTDITFGTITQFVAGNMSAGSGEGVPVIYDPDTNKSIVAFKNATDGDIGQFTELTVSGTSVTGGSATTFQSGSGVTYVSGAYDTNANKTVLAYTNLANSNYGTGVVITPNTSTLTSTNLLGLAAGAISNTATGTINTWGSRNEAAFPVLATGSTTNLTGKTQSPYPDITYDITQGKFVVFFEDGNNSNYGTAVVATVSGSTVSFGTPVVFNSGTTIALGATYSEANGRHVVVYPNYSDSQKATAAVGTVSGTSISFGTPVVFDSTITNTQCSVAYNSTLGKYLAGAMTSTIKVTVLTVDPSDNSVTFGTPVSLTGTRYKPNIVSNESASDFVLTNNLNDNQSEAHLISVSGTTPTVEDTETLSSVVTYSYPTTGLVFLENNKFLSVYYDQGTENTYARTITVSGSSLSLGTESAAFNTDPGNQTMINGRYPLFFVSTTEAYLYYQDDATDYLRYVPITVSGTTATSGTEVTYYSTAVAYEGFGYNSSTKQSLSFFQGNDGGQQTQAVAQNGALVIGTDYYVQLDGSLSTDTGGQLIGQAITTTQINIKDYTG
jgi:hypothetical protein